MAKKKSREDCIRDFKKVHGDRYDYSKFVNNGNKKNSIFICPIHGEFEQTPDNHLHSNGCKYCGIEQRALKRRKSVNEFEKEAKIIHNNKYKYFQDYINDITPIRIKCLVCGHIFPQPPTSHLSGHGCPECKKIKLSQIHQCDYAQFELKANIVHNNFYVYHHDYKSADSDVIITCPIHGDFHQNANSHLCGRGCPKCKSSHMETEIRILLQENNIEFEEQKRFEWLGLQSLDFYLPKYNIGIECQGIQHFEPKEHFGGANGLLQRKILDERKNQLCKENQIKILYYANYEYNFPYKVIKDKVNLLNEIKTFLY